MIAVRSSHDEMQPDELVTIREFGDMPEALLAQGCLASAGIESFLADENIARIDWAIVRGTRLQVDPDDAEESLTILDQSALEEPEEGDPEA